LASERIVIECEIPVNKITMRDSFVSMVLAFVLCGPINPAASRAAETGGGTTDPNLYEITAVDLGAKTFTASYRGNLVTLEDRADTEVVINGTEMGFKDLEPGMEAKVRLAEPGAAARIEAAGNLSLDPTTDDGSTVKTVSPLLKVLCQGLWTRETGSHAADYQFLPDGTLYFISLPKKIKYRWAWIDRGARKVELISGKGMHSFLKFDLRAATYVGLVGDTDEPDPSMHGHLVKDGTDQSQ
jgi:hypothetical protein